MDGPQRIAMVTPHVWGVPHPTNDAVGQLAASLAAAGVEVLVVAPSARVPARRTSRRALRALAQGADPAEVLGAAALRDAATGVPVLAVGVPVPGANQAVALRSSLRTLFDHGAFDLLVVVDPLGSELARQALRTFHGLTIGVVHALPPAGPLEPLAVGRDRGRLAEGLDAVAVADGPRSGQLAAAVAERLGVAVDEVAVLPVVAAHADELVRADPDGAVVVARGEGDDATVGHAIRHLAGWPTPPKVVLLTRYGSTVRPFVPRALRGLVRSVHARSGADARAALDGARAVLVTAQTPDRFRAEVEWTGLPVAELAQGDDLALLLADLPTSSAPAQTAPPVRPEQLADGLLDLARGLFARRGGRAGTPHVAARPVTTGAAAHPCVIDLHMHTNHSKDCATDPEALLWAAREAGLTAVAVTDHDAVSGAFAVAELAADYGIQVVVGEEVMTAVGEVIGLFLTERVEPGMPWVDTLEAIHAQGGVVYVPHPFDRMHTIPDIHTLRASVDQLDVLEVCNGRLAFEQYNRDALRFARKYGLLEGAGSDAHVVQGLGSARVRMPAFDDPASFLSALRRGTIERTPTNYLYVQALKRVDAIRGRAGAGMPGRATD